MRNFNDCGMRDLKGNFIEKDKVMGELVSESYFNEMIKDFVMKGVSVKITCNITDGYHCIEFSNIMRNNILPLS